MAGRVGAGLNLISVVRFNGRGPRSGVE